MYEYSKWSGLQVGMPGKPVMSDNTKIEQKLVTFLQFGTAPRNLSPYFWYILAFRTIIAA
jgi:hypothetical protein